MPFSPGERLGPYEIVAPLGAGGMGEVYRALDPKLNRDVAIKVLPAAFSDDAQCMARFEREAQMLAALNHPNIATVYGIEQGALVMELVEGADLKGPVPLDEALAIASQIAAGLEAAHEKGIIHRDLKPANIKLTPAGVVKILDFGLAKASESAVAANSSMTTSPTLSMEMTRAGMILGTAAYMSPEQAAGKPVDRRADIWSFGVVLWEMLTGRQMFRGETVSHTLANVLRAEIDLTTLPAGTPAAVRTLLRRCLDRNVRNRLRDIGEARVALETAPAAEGESAPSAAGSGSGKLAWMVAAAAVVVASVLGFLYWRGTRPVLRPAQRFDMPFTPAERLRPHLALSPDGTRLAYEVRDAGNNTQIYTRLLSEPEGVPLKGTEGGAAPFFSPDGQWLGFSAGGSLKKVQLGGGTAVKLCYAPDMRGASWGEDGYIVFTPDNRSPLMRVSDAGGLPVAITQLNPSEISHRGPQVLGGGKWVLFMASPSAAQYELSSIQLLNVATREIHTLHRGGFGSKFVQGYLLWAHEGALFGAPVDLEKGQLTGSAIPLLERLGSDNGSGLGNFDVSRTGIYAGITGGGLERGGSLAWGDAAGKVHPLPFEKNVYSALRISPDGSHIAVGVGQPGKVDTFVGDLSSGRLTQVTFGVSTEVVIWALDGKHLVVQDDGLTKLYWVSADGGSPTQLLYAAAAPLATVQPLSFLPDGTSLIVGPGKSGHEADLYRLPIDLHDPDHPKGGLPERILTASLGTAALSPDGKWLAYPARIGDKTDLYVEPFPHTGAKWRVPEGGRVVGWTAELLFYSASRQIAAVRWHAQGNTFVTEKAVLWETASELTPWDVFPDGKRLLGLLRDEPRPTQLTFIVNFADELRRRVPPGE